MVLSICIRSRIINETAVHVKVCPGCWIGQGLHGNVTNPCTSTVCHSTPPDILTHSQQLLDAHQQLLDARVISKGTQMSLKSHLQPL